MKRGCLEATEVARRGATEGRYRGAPQRGATEGLQGGCRGAAEGLSFTNYTAKDERL